MTTYRAVPFMAIVRRPGVFGVTITLVSGPSMRLITR